MTVNITINLLWALIALVISLALFLIHNYVGIKLFIKKDEGIANKFLDKFPLVTVDFCNKNLKLQNIENNQEIHEINKKFEKLEELVQKVMNNANRT